MGRPRSFDEAALLDSAFALFRQRGFQRTSLADVARANGLERASLYNAYGDKQTLFLAAYRRYADRYLSAVATAMANRNTLREQLFAYCEVSIDNFCQGDPPMSCPTTRGLLELELWDREGQDSTARKAFADLLHGVIDLVTAAFTEAVNSGEFEGDPRAAATQLVTTVRGLVILERAYATREALMEIAVGCIALLVPERAQSCSSRQRA